MNTLEVTAVAESHRLADKLGTKSYSSPLELDKDTGHRIVRGTRAHRETPRETPPVSADSRAQTRGTADVNLVKTCSVVFFVVRDMRQLLGE